MDTRAFLINVHVANTLNDFLQYGTKIATAISTSAVLYALTQTSNVYGFFTLVENTLYFGFFVYPGAGLNGQLAYSDSTPYAYTATTNNYYLGLYKFPGTVNDWTREYELIPWQGGDPTSSIDIRSTVDYIISGAGNLYPITYHYTNSIVSGPSEAAVGDTVTVSAVSDVGYGITDASTQILITNNDVAVPYTWDAVNNRITFTMPDPS